MSSDQLAGLLPLVLLVLVFWFLILRPARKRQRETANTQRSLEVGSQIMLTSGIFGTVESLDDETMDVQIAAGTTITAHRQAVAKVIPDEDLDEEYSNDDEEYSNNEVEPETDGNE